MKTIKRLLLNKSGYKRDFNTEEEIEEFITEKTEGFRNIAFSDRERLPEKDLEGKEIVTELRKLKVIQRKDIQRHIDKLIRAGIMDSDSISLEDMLKIWDDPDKENMFNYYSFYWLASHLTGKNFHDSIFMFVNTSDTRITKGLIEEVEENPDNFYLMAFNYYV